jgi:hypothetical protein
MRDRPWVLVRRIAAALGVSVVLHVALVAVCGVYLLGGLVAVFGGDPRPLIVDVVDAGERPLVQPVAARPPAPKPVEKPRPVKLPAVEPPAKEEAPAVPEPAREAEIVTPPEPEVAAAPPAPEPPRPAEQTAPPQPVEPAAAEPPAEESPAAVADVPPRPAHAADEPAQDYAVSRARLDDLARNPSLSASAMGEPFLGRKEVFEFLLDHPDFAGHVIRVLRGRNRSSDEGLILEQTQVVHAASGLRVLYARGEVKQKLMPAIPGEIVLTVRYDALPTEDGRDLLVANVSSQVKIGGSIGEMLSKLAGPAVVEKAEKESRRLVRTLARVVQAVDERPAKLYAGLLERPGVSRDELEQFRALLKLP